MVDVSVLFFFSSRRRHTRCSRDWSSDVCSSDLIVVRGADAVTLLIAAATSYRNYADVGADPAARVASALASASGKTVDALREIGRASCREREEDSVVGGSLKKKSHYRNISFHSN